MIIKIIPETEAEKAKHEEVTFSGVKEFFVMGVHRDEDDHLVDFHQWEGSYKFLMTSLQWYHQLIEDERQEALFNKTMRTANRKIDKQPFVKRGQVLEPKLEVIQETAEETRNEGVAETSPRQEDKLAKIFGTKKDESALRLVPKQVPTAEELEKIAKNLNRTETD